MHPLPILLLAALLLNSFGQTPQTAAPKHPRPEEVGEDDIVRVDTTLVGVPVTVLDREGRFVPGLKREDFHIYEDGEEQRSPISPRSKGWFCNSDGVSIETAAIDFDDGECRPNRFRPTETREENVN